MHTNPIWTCQQSVDADVPVTVAWQFMSDVHNWSDPPAEFALEGRFAPGTRGTTKMPGQPATSWMIRDVAPGRGYTIVGALQETASLIVHWRFDPLPDDRTRLTQRLELCGEDAAHYVDTIRAAFEPHLEPGMQRIARLMRERAIRER
jgi:polyketide cyclase/dehydrase/lipid transport protein